MYMIDVDTWTEVDGESALGNLTRAVTMMVLPASHAQDQVVAKKER